MATLRLCPGAERSLDLRRVGGFRGAGAQGLRDGRAGAAVAHALSPSGRMVAAVAGLDRGSAAGAIGFATAWFLSLIHI